MKTLLRTLASLHCNTKAQSSTDNGQSFKSQIHGGQ